FLTSTKDPRGNITLRTPTRFDNRAAVTYPDGSTESWTRDSFDRILSHTNTRGKTTTYTRDTLGRVIAIAYPDGGQESFAYNGFGQVLKHTQLNGGVAENTYDSRGLKTSTKDPNGKITVFAYDSLDRISSMTDPIGNTTGYGYDDRGNITEIVNADGTRQTYEYNEFGMLTRFTNELGNSWTYRYDDFKRRVSTTDPLSNTTTYSYAAPWELAIDTVTLPSGRKTKFTYDTNLRPTSITTGDGTSEASMVTSTFDAAGNRTSVTDANGATLSFAYDQRNRRISQTDSLGNTTHFTYDERDNLLTETRPNGGVTAYAYDVNDRLVEITDPAGNKTLMAYDASGNLLSLADARNNTYSYTYDAQNRQTEMIYPDGSRESYTYDDAGRQTSYTSRAGKVCTHTYDSRDRVVQSSWNDGFTPSVTNAYDVASRLISNSNGKSALSFTYDAANRLTAETQNLTALNPQLPAFTVGYGYDGDGNQVSLTYPDGSAVDYIRDARAQLAEVTLDGPPPLATYSYDLAGNRIGRTMENGTSTAYAYDSANRLTSVEHRSTLGVFANFAYTLNSVGNRTTKVAAGTGIPNVTEIYGYDAIDQITQAVYGATRTVNYAYDAAGNRTAVIDNGFTTSYAANSLNQYTALSSLPAPAYDANGNLTAFNGSTYSYDAQNRLTGTSNPGALGTFAYDSRNRQTSRTVNGVTTWFVYDGWNLIAEYAANGSLLRKYIHGATTDEILARIDANGILYYHQDGLGSTIALTDSNADVVESCHYDVFGKPTFFNSSGQTLATSAMGNRFLFTGREWLPEFGLYDHRHRIYSADLGRFLQTDPIGFAADDINLYRYVGNHPINWTDPYGLDLDVYLERDYADRHSPGNYKVVEDGKTLYEGRANENPFFPNSQGVKEGDYSLKPKGDKWGPGRYPSDQPAIVGSDKDLKPGQPNASYKAPALIHQKGSPGRPDSSACITVDAEAEKITKDALARNPDSSRLHIREPKSTSPPVRRALWP
ncbi:MAG TPA: RHS repeat-associated core domain-containing protein, partial [Chthoniobacterales bacterium]